MDTAEDSADIFDSALSALFQVPPIGFSTADPSKPHVYTPPSGREVQLWLPQPPASVYAALQANNLWLSAVYLADMVGRGELEVSPGIKVVELGAAAGLPGIMAARAGGFVVGTDYDDESIIKVMRRNYAGALGEGGEIKDDAVASDAVASHNSNTHHWAVRGHSWGTDPTPLLNLAGGQFDVVLLADTLWSTPGHADLLDSVVALLKDGGVAHVAAGLHTGRGPVARFMDMANDRGFQVQFIREVAWMPGGGWGESTARKDAEGEERGIVMYYILTKGVQ